MFCNYAYDTRELEVYTLEEDRKDARELLLAVLSDDPDADLDRFISEVAADAAPEPWAHKFAVLAERRDIWDLDEGLHCEIQRTIDEWLDHHFFDRAYQILEEARQAIINEKVSV